MLWNFINEMCPKNGLKSISLFGGRDSASYTHNTDRNLSSGVL